jgi:tetratricopeptide (TPR) repeat protein
MTLDRLARLGWRFGRACSFWGWDGGAVVGYREALRHDAHFVDAHFALGEAHLRRREWAESVEAFREVVRREPSNPEALGNLALALAQQGAVERAAQALRRLGQARPQEPEPHLLIGALLKKQRRTAEAIASFRHAATLRPAPQGTRFFLGETLLGSKAWVALLQSHREVREAGAPVPVRMRPGSLPVASPRRTPVARPSRRLRQRLGTTLRRLADRTVAAYLVASGKAQLFVGRFIASQRRPHEAIRAFRQALAQRARLDPAWAWTGGPRSTLGSAPRSRPVLGPAGRRGA